MKKLCIATVLCLAAALAFGQRLSFGAGLSYGAHWGAFGGTESGADQTVTISMPPVGFHVFADARYAQLTIGYLLSSSQKIDASTSSSISMNFSDSISLLDLELVGKYPLALGGITVFPFAGIEYFLTLDNSFVNAINYDIEQPKDWLDGLFVKAGVGADIPVSTHLYVRSELFAGYKVTRSSWDKDNIDNMKDGGLSDIYFNYWEIRGMVLVGYKL